LVELPTPRIDRTAEKQPQQEIRPPRSLCRPGMSSAMRPGCRGEVQRVPPSSIRQLELDFSPPSSFRWFLEFADDKVVEVPRFIPGQKEGGSASYAPRNRPQRPSGDPDPRCARRRSLLRVSGDTRGSVEDDTDTSGPQVGTQARGSDG
jgi:hypothetical protein